MPPLKWSASGNVGAGTLSSERRQRSAFWHKRCPQAGGAGPASHLPAARCSAGQGLHPADWTVSPPQEAAPTSWLAEVKWDFEVQVSARDRFWDPPDTKLHGCSSPL